MMSTINRLLSVYCTRSLFQAVRLLSGNNSIIYITKMKDDNIVCVTASRPSDRDTLSSPFRNRRMNEPIGAAGCRKKNTVSKD